MQTHGTLLDSGCLYQLEFHFIRRLRKYHEIIKWGLKTHKLHGNAKKKTARIELGIRSI